MDTRASLLAYRHRTLKRKHPIGFGEDQMSSEGTRILAQSLYTIIFKKVAYMLCCVGALPYSILSKSALLYLGEVKVI